MVLYKSPTSGNHASLLCDLGQGADFSLCLQFLHEKSGVNLALIIP